MPIPDAAKSPALKLTRSTDDDYPSSLRELPQPPDTLWSIGRWELTAWSPIVAIVGTRDSTPYGERVTRELTQAFVREGALILSGMARGIDAVAHRTALAEGAPTIAVLGTGVDLSYPVGHRALHEEIGRSGLLISEYEPGTRAFKGSFVRRNRIIAALAKATIVVEAGHDSGALTTANFATDLGRTVAAVPGQIDAPQSVGANRLIRDNALIIGDVADALALVGLTRPIRRPREFDDPDVTAVYSALGDGPLDVDRLCARSGLPAQRCLTAVTELELRGAIECLLTGAIQRR